MKPQTQYERILRFLRAQGRRGATTMEMIQACGSVCPWKRIEEMTFAGVLLSQYLPSPSMRGHVWIITRTPEMRAGNRLTVYRLEKVR